jgi:hypothetical protein
MLPPFVPSTYGAEVVDTRKVEAVPVLYAPSVGLSDRQLAVADLIVEEFLAAGFGPAVAAAAVVNAFRESSLDPSEESETKKYVGLFQVSPDIEPSREKRKDAKTNTRLIIEQAKKSKAFMRVASETSDIPTLAGAFAVYVERPKDKPGEEFVRSALAAKMYPTDFWQNAAEALPVRVPKGHPTPLFDLTEDEARWVAWGAGAAAVAWALFYFRLRENLRKTEDRRV